MESPGRSGKRILLTTVYAHKLYNYDYWSANYPPRRLKYSLKRATAPGLRFIKQNVPEVEVMEYPTWEEYQFKLKEGWDVVGISFYMNETPGALEMVKAARKAGASEIWGGNYGILTPEIQKHFDRICLGHGEKMIADNMGRKITNMYHPPLYWHMGTSPGIDLAIIGQIVTVRGCKMKCTFCQTPSFCEGVERVPLESLDIVLEYYKSLGINTLNVLGENFGINKKHTEELVELLGKHGMYWYPCVRPDLLPEDLDHWIENGLIGVQIGVESFNSDAVQSLDKVNTLNETLEAIERLKEQGRMVLAFYMLGHETDTAQTLKEGVSELAKLKLNFHQVCVLTPLPATPLWNTIEEKYGIFEKDYHKYNAKHLVWNHPHISPEKMRELLVWTFNKLYPRQFPLRYFKQQFRAMRGRNTFGGTVTHFRNTFNMAHRLDQSRLDAYYNPETGKWQ